MPRRAGRTVRTTSPPFAPSAVPGQIEASPEFLALAHFFDQRLRHMALDLGAEERSYGPLLSTATLERLDYFRSFPQRAVRLDGPGHAVLPPAVCFHVYEQLARSTLPLSPWSVTASGRCFRGDEKTSPRTPERLLSFTMREWVWFGAARRMDALRRRVIGRTETILARVGMEGKIQAAADSFFVSDETRGKVLLQRLRTMKLELRVRVRGRKLALASFNLHGGFFARRMHIALPGGELAESGCAAFGLERWVYAFLESHGPDRSRWPSAVRTHLHTYAEGQ